MRGSPALLRDALLVAGKDLRVEARSRVATNQVAPFALLVLVLFAFALDPSRGLLERVAPGLFWVAVLFTTLAAVQRSAAVDTAAGVRDALRLSGLDPSGVFLGKALAVGGQLLVLELLLAAGVVVFYGSPWWGGGQALAAALAATVGLAAAGTLYGALAAGVRARETLLPLLLLPVLAPVLVAGTRAFEAASGLAADDGWAWVTLLGVFAAVYLAVGVVAYPFLLEDS